MNGVNITRGAIFTLAVISAFLVFGFSAAFADNDSSKLSMNYQKAYDNFQKAKANYDSAKEDWQAAKQAYVSANKTVANKTAEIANRTAQAVDKGKAYLNKTTSRMISHLELVKSKVAENKVLSDSEKANITADLDSDIATLTALQAQIPGITTVAQLKNLSVEIKNAWVDARKGVARAVGLVEQEKYQKVAEQAQNASAKMQKVIDLMNAKGLDSTEFQALLSDYNNHVSLAKADFLAAKDKFLAGDNSAAKELLKSGREELKEAQGVAKEFAKKVREGAKQLRKANQAQKKNESKSKSEDDNEGETD